MIHRRRIVSALALLTILIVAATGTAKAQVPYDLTKKLVTLVTVPADSAGNASADVTLPNEVTAGYEVLANGKDPAGQPRSVFADVTITGSAAPAVNGQSVTLIAFGQTVQRKLHVSASGFLPNSPVSFSVRFTAPATASSGLPFSGSNVGLLIAIAAAVLLVGGPLTFGSRKLAERAHERAVD